MATSPRGASAADLVGISRTTAYAEAQRYRDSGGTIGLPNVKLGRRVLILTAGLADLLQIALHGPDH